MPDLYLTCTGDEDGRFRNTQPYSLEASIQTVILKCFMKLLLACSAAMAMHLHAFAGPLIEPAREQQTHMHMMHPIDGKWLAQEKVLAYSQVMAQLKPDAEQLALDGMN